MRNKRIQIFDFVGYVNGIKYGTQFLFNVK